MRVVKNMTPTIKVILFSLLLLPIAASAAWFEASGQAIVSQGNKDLARQRATQEAIKQILLFSGANVSSVQKMANGLLQDDRFEIRSNGDVDSIELMNEHYDGDIVTVSIRADVFPNKNKCQAADYQKSLVTTWFPLRHREQAMIGGLFDFGQNLARKLQLEFEQYAQYTQITHIAPFYPKPRDVNGEAAMQLASQHQTQYALFAEVTQLDVSPTKSNGLMFWRDNTPERHLGINITVFNGTTGDKIFSQEFNNHALWDFSDFEKVSTNSQSFWSSRYGQAAKDNLQNLAQIVDEKLSCLPAFGRVLKVDDEHVSINLGSADGVKSGDELQLFQLTQFYDRNGRSQYQYHIHPVTLNVTDVFVSTAILKSLTEQTLANIQANDFVMRR
ncbi:flagellar assembly protein T N-terminal domain-containing protein [Alteromonadaceae bacterium BrNp21-10]|nr:flagellar assembly protein T N-terminal domain-containing protein [Alteromonadaceae bacterium BrNp21-10]